MTAKNSVEAGNDHLMALLGHTRQMVAANRVPADKASDFLGALSEAMNDTAACLEEVAETVAVAFMENADAASGADTPEEAPKRHPRTSKLREALRANFDIDPESMPLPAVVQASRYVAPKRGVGRPRKDIEPVVLTPEQMAFDHDFLARHPVLEGITVENSIGATHLTVIFDGKKLKMIKRHLETYGINFDDYKRIYSLPDDYPSVASGYAGERRKHAIRQGLGTPKVPKGTRKKATVEVAVIDIPAEKATAAA